MRTGLSVGLSVAIASLVALWPTVLATGAATAGAACSEVESDSSIDAASDAGAARDPAVVESDASFSVKCDDIVTLDIDGRRVRIRMPVPCNPYYRETGRPLP